MKLSELIKMYLLSLQQAVPIILFYFIYLFILIVSEVVQFSIYVFI